MNLKDADVLKTIEIEDVKKDSRVYSAKFAEKLVLQTKRSTLRSDIFNDDGEILPFATVELDGESAAAIAAFEDWILETSKANKAAWFKKAISDAYLDSSFKTYLKTPPTANRKKALTAKVAEDFTVFSTEGEVLDLERAALPVESQAIFLFEASQITFGKTEFGCLWKLKQAVLLPAKPKPECLIQYDKEATVATVASVEDEDAEYFL